MIDGHKDVKPQERLQFLHSDLPSLVLLVLHHLLCIPVGLLHYLFP